MSLESALKQVQDSLDDIENSNFINSLRAISDCFISLTRERNVLRDELDRALDEISVKDDMLLDAEGRYRLSDAVSALEEIKALPTWDTDPHDYTSLVKTENGAWFWADDVLEIVDAAESAWNERSKKREYHLSAFRQGKLQYLLEMKDDKIDHLMDTLKHIARHYGSAEQCRELAQNAINYYEGEE